MQKYRIKKEYRKLLFGEYRLFYKETESKLLNGMYYYFDNSNTKIYSEFKDEMMEKAEEESDLKVTGLHLEWLQPSQHIFKYTVRFETNKEIGVKMNGNNIEITEFDGVAFAESSSKVKERIEVKFHGAFSRTEGVVDDEGKKWPNGIEYTLKINTNKDVDWEKLRPTFEAYVNGDMVENDKPIENQYFNLEEYRFEVNDFNILTVYPLKTKSSDDEPMINDSLTWPKDIVLYEKEGVVRKTDNAEFTNHEMINMTKVINGDLHTEEQMIEKVKDYVKQSGSEYTEIDGDIRLYPKVIEGKILSVEEFINTK